jgi:hypothetical protein
MKLKAQETISLQPVEVTIECSDPKTRSFTFVDTPGMLLIHLTSNDITNPGMFRTDIQQTGKRSQADIEKEKLMIRKIIDKYAAKPENLILLVENGNQHPGQVDTFATLIKKHDPKMERTVAVCTHLDLKFTENSFITPSNLPTIKEVRCSTSRISNIPTAFLFMEECMTGNFHSGLDFMIFQQKSAPT